MATSIKTDERVKDVAFDDDSIAVSLMDGWMILVLLVWYRRLLRATRGEWGAWEVCGGGYGLYWGAIDEDLSTEGMLRGAPVAVE
jgi:hypothetical protein